MTTETTETLLEFPCDFPIKIMGEQNPDFVPTILAVVQQYAPKTTEQDLKFRESSKGNYLGLTVIIKATDQQQLDNIYRALTGHDMVKVVL